ncbi:MULTISPECIES: helix-turn-helix transcriptional regulator [Pseudomonas]|uniref:Transcriptional regulator, AlpA family n=1 Tax=Pseudomonas lutea TaxID=243924 RepID=A0A9X8MHR6_9PSED|nr:MULTISPECIES: AlpA family transcriptional regulator [Pseudomonas]SER49168.1 transcriptional regulator, AlpA family [Pseudomonas lutea]
MSRHSFQHLTTITPGNRLLRVKTVQDKTGMSRPAIYAAIRRGTFPAPLPIGSQSVAWLEAEVDAWIQARLDARNTALAIS